MVINGYEIIMKLILKNDYRTNISEPQKYYYMDVFFCHITPKAKEIVILVVLEIRNKLKFTWRCLSFSGIFLDKILDLFQTKK